MVSEIFVPFLKGKKKTIPSLLLKPLMYKTNYATSSWLSATTSAESRTRTIQFHISSPHLSKFYQHLVLAQHPYEGLRQNLCWFVFNFYNNLISVPLQSFPPLSTSQHLDINWRLFELRDKFSNVCQPILPIFLLLWYLLPDTKLSKHRAFSSQSNPCPFHIILFLDLQLLLCSLEYMIHRITFCYQQEHSPPNCQHSQSTGLRVSSNQTKKKNPEIRKLWD